MENPFNLKGENHEIFFDNVGNLQKKSPLDLPLGNKTNRQCEDVGLEGHSPLHNVVFMGGAQCEDV